MDRLAVPASAVPLHTYGREVSTAADAAGARGRFSVRTISDPAELAAEWIELEAHAIGTIYQSYSWVSAWCRIAAGPLGERPVIVAGQDAAGTLAFVLPLAITRRHGLLVLSWLGQVLGAYCMGLYRSDAVDAIGEHELRDILRQVALLHPEATSLHLKFQPATWDGHVNPFARMGAQPTLGRYYHVDLSKPFDRMLAEDVPRRVRSELARRERRIAELGRSKVRVAGTPDERLDMLEEFLRQKEHQLLEHRSDNVFALEPVAGFFRALARDPDSRHPLELAALDINDAPVAMLVGVTFAGIFHHLNLSMVSGEIQKVAPGSILLKERLRHHCAAGARVWDFGPGFGRHKQNWNPREVAMVETYVALHPLGVLHAAAWRVLARARDAIKSRPRLLAAVRKLRGLVFAWRHESSHQDNAE